MNLRLFNLFSTFTILLLLIVLQPSAQTIQRDNRPRTASIGGRVTIGDASATNALVMVMEVDSKTDDMWFGDESPQRAFIKVRTDTEGRYRVTGLTEGTYMIRALSQAYVWSKKSSKFDTFKSVTLDDGEAREGVDIALVRGGVITGRVIDAAGMPLIASSLNLQSVDENGNPVEGIDNDHWVSMQTDDRGIYRIYGLPAGRYIISAGGELASNRNSKYPQTFYPDATDQDNAKSIEVKEGTEITGIDIRLSVEQRTYEATGRVIDAETGQPLKQVSLICWNNPDGGNRSGSEASTDDEGRFKFTGLTSGRYEAGLWNFEHFSVGPVPLMSNEHYSEKTMFEISDSDVSGLEVKAIRGSTLSGVVVIEGGDDPANKKLPQMAVSVQITGKQGTERVALGHSIVKITGDGGFRFTGLEPGTASFDLHQRGQKSIFSIKRIERDGAEIKSSFEIGRGEQIKGVRIVLAHRNGTIRGQVEIAGGKLPDGLRLRVLASPIRTAVGDDGISTFHPGGGSAWADEKGRFIIESLMAGEYELSLTAMERTGQDEYIGFQVPSELKQRITVSNGVETPVKLTFDPAHSQHKNRQ